MVKRLELREIDSFVRKVAERLEKEGFDPLYHTAPDVDNFIGTWERMVGSGFGMFYGLTTALGPAGILAGALVPDLIAGVPQGVEIVWVVVPSDRERGQAFDLLRQFEADVKEAGGRAVVCGCTSNLKPMWRMYERQGYQFEGATFRKEL